MALIDHAVAAIRPFVDDVVIVGRDWAGLATVADRPAPGLGPLGGIAAALAEAESRECDAVLTIGCDMPQVPADLIAAMVARAPAFCPGAPILGAWRAGGSADLIARLTTDPDRSVRRWAIEIGATPVPATGSLYNVNTPADLLE